ncbi:RING finger family protein [Zostera marina]|uniref:RING finger family protein n=1 Tax=Zostera marina TaxID=29655 RepID=A0A0K9PM05_ZOSMR|nr:RING finger family protein [Zostera marina]
MEFIRDHPFSSPLASTTSLPSSSSSSSSSGRLVLQFAEQVIYITLTVIFAIVGSIAGAITGGLIGLATESGLLRGTGIGAISGAVFSIEVGESSLAIWHSNRSGISSILFVIDTIVSLLSGRLVREKIDPAMQNAVQNQLSAIVDTPLQEILDIFETGGTKGMMKDAVDEIPKMIFTHQNNDTNISGDRICCSVCLQDFQTGEIVRNLPHCYHIFHLPCIDGWLMRNASCPLCRNNF